jgi:hypothetical protein
MDPHLVAFIDILGFGHEVKAAKDSEALARIHDKVIRIQQAFEKPSALGIPRAQSQLNRQYGKRVIALSDAVLIAIDFNCNAQNLLGDSDLVGWAVYKLIQAQYDCVLNHGIFLRGGVGVGPFFLENYVLVSPALVDAHELESRHADAPIIVLTKQTVDWIKKTAGPNSSVPNFENVFFRSLSKTCGDEPLFALDYLRVAMTDDEPGIVLEAHKQKVAAAYAATTNERVRDKYRALMRYHNETIDHLLNGELFRPYRFDLTLFTTPA